MRKATSLGLLAAAAVAGVVLGRCSAVATTGRLRARLTDAENRLAHDPVTGLLNRTGLIAHFTATAHRSRWLVLVDINGFKQVNDRYGHHIGDALLEAFGTHLGAVACCEGGVAGRIGGDEFVLIVPTAADPPGGTDGLVTALRNPMPFPGSAGSQSLSASSGVCLAGPAVPWPEALRRADIALYHSKATASRVTFYTQGMTQPNPPTPGLRPDPRLRDVSHFPASGRPALH